MVPLAIGALNTELTSWASNDNYRKQFPTFQKVAEEIQKEYEKGTPQAKTLVDRWHYGDVEYAAGRIWQANLPRAQGGDGLGQLQGSSVVSSAGGGACFHRLVFDGGFRKSWGSILVGILGSLTVFDNLAAYFAVGSELQAGGEQVAHGLHLMGQLTGFFMSWFVKWWYKI